MREGDREVAGAAWLASVLLFWRPAMTRRTSYRTLALLLAVLVTGACHHEGEPVKVGVVLPLSGASSVYGEAIQRGISLAADELQRRHREGSYPYELALDVRDSGGKPEAAAKLLSALYDADAVAAIGGVTNPEAHAMVAVAKKAQRVLLSPSASSSSVAAASRYVFRIFPSDRQQANKIGSFASLELKLGNAVVVASADPYAKELIDGFESEFKRNGGKVLGEVAYPAGTDQVRPIVEQALATHPQAVYLATTGADRTARQILDELDHERFRGVVMTTSAFAAPQVLDETGRGAEGLIFSRSGFDPAQKDPRVRAFVQAYRAKYGEDPGIYAAHGYDALMVLARSVADEEAVPWNIWKGLRGLSDYRGVTGFIQFDEQGNVGQFPRVYVVDHGKVDEFGSLGKGTKRRLVRRVGSLAGEGRRLVSS